MVSEMTITVKRDLKQTKPNQTKTDAYSFLRPECQSLHVLTIKNVKKEWRDEPVIKISLALN